MQYKIKIALAAVAACAGIALSATQAYAGLTLGSASITSGGALTVTGSGASTWDIGSGTLSLQTTTNGAITTGTGTFTAAGNVTLGSTSTDYTIIKSHLSTATASGSPMYLNAGFNNTEGVDLQYTINSWAGIGTSETFYGMYLSPRTNVAAQNASLTGLLIKASDGVSSTGYAFGAIRGLEMDTQIKPLAVSATAGPIYGIDQIVSLYAPQSSYVLTLATTSTDSVGAAAAKFVVGLPSTGDGNNGTLFNYEAVAGVVIQTNGSLTTKTLGSGLLFRNDAATADYTWNKGIQMVNKAVTGISLEGAMTTGINIAGAATTGLKISGIATNDISLQNGATIANSSNGVTTIRGNGTNGNDLLTVYGNLKIVNATTTVVTGIDPGSQVKLMYEFTEAATSSPQGMQISAVNGTASTNGGGVTGLEVKAKSKTGVTGALGTIRGIVATADARNRTVTTMKGAEVQVSGSSGATVTTAVALNVVNQLHQTGTYTSIYGIDIQADNVANTADIRLSGGASATIRPTISSGSGVPDGATCTAATNKGSLYINTAGTAGDDDLLYICGFGGDWVAVTIP